MFATEKQLYDIIFLIKGKTNCQKNRSSKEVTKGHIYYEEFDIK